VVLSRRQLIKLHNKRKLCADRYRVASVLSRDARDSARSLALSAATKSNESLDRSRDFQRSPIDFQPLHRRKNCPVERK